MTGCKWYLNVCYCRSACGLLAFAAGASGIKMSATADRHSEKGTTPPDVSGIKMSASADGQVAGSVHEKV